jgi:PKD repeat protein
MAWDETSQIRLGGVGDMSGVAVKFGPGRICIPKGTSVPSETQYTFNFTMTAPAQGSYTPQYRMVWEGHQWFGGVASRPVIVGNSDSLPHAQFTSDTAHGNSPLIVQFTDQSTGAGPMTYHWDFSDGEGNLPENSQQNPVWRFWEETGTTYTVTLTVTNAFGSDTIVKQNYISLGTAPASAPVAAFTTSATSGIAPLAIRFNDQSEGTPLTYAWDINNDGTTDYTIKNPSHTYTSAGNYTVKLTVTNDGGSDNEIKTNYITISAVGIIPTPTQMPLPTPTPAPAVVPAKLPVAKFAANTTQGKAPLVVQFTDTSVSTGTTSYAWDMNNDGVSDYTTKNPLHTFTSAGSYSVKLTITNSSGSDSEIKTGYITATSSSMQTGECFGAVACNPTGNPIGGGAGYSKIISGTEAGVKYTVSTKAELLTALKNAKSGETVFVKGTSVIDMTGTPSVTIPAGVTLAGNRGLAGSSGALIKRTKNLNGGWEEPMFIIGGDNVRVTGLQLEGEMYPQDYGNNAVYPGSINERYYLVGLYANGVKNLVVDNNELRGWAWASVSLRQCSGAFIHHNYIHHNQARGEGYGVCMYSGNALIEANLFDYNRHDVTGAGMSGEQYEARYNRHLGHGNAIGAANYDVHQDEETGTGLAGNLFKIHHNTIDGGVVAALQVRGMPKTGMYVDHNIINSVASDTGVTGNRPIFQTSAGTGNMFVTQNYWQGKLYPTDSGIVVYY